MAINVRELERFRRSRLGLDLSDASGTTVPAETEIANQLLRLRAVGVEPPPPPSEETDSLLQRIFDILELGSETRPLLGLPEPEEFVDRLGIQSNLGRAATEFLYSLATDPLTYLTLGVGGVARATVGAAAQAAPRLVLRAGVPFLTRTAEIAIPGTEGIARTITGAAQAIGRAIEPAVGRLARAISPARVPLGAEPSVREGLQLFFQARRRAQAVERMAEEELAAVIQRMRQVTQDLPDFAQPMVALFRESPALAKSLGNIAPGASAGKNIQEAFERIQGLHRRMEDYARATYISPYMTPAGPNVALSSLDPQLAGRVLFDVLPAVQRARNLMERLRRPGLTAAEEARLRAGLNAARVDFVAQLRSHLEQQPPHIRDALQRYISGLFRELYRPAAPGQPGIQGFLRGVQPKLDEIRLAAAMLAEGPGGRLRTAVEQLGQLARTMPDEYARIVQTVKAGAKELGRIVDQLYDLEKLYGFNYRALARYVPHLYAEPPERVQAILEQLTRVEQQAARHRSALSPRAGFSKHRTLRTLLDAVARGGLTPVWDPVRLAALRTAMSIHARSRMQLVNVIKDLAKTHPQVVVRLKKGSQVPQGWELGKDYIPALSGYAIHPEIAHSLQQFEALFGPEEFMELFSSVTRWLNIWKAIVVSRPGTHLRNFLGNSMLMGLAGVPVQEQFPLLLRATNLVRTARAAERLLRDDPANMQALSMLAQPAVRVGNQTLTVGDVWNIVKREGLLGFGTTAEMRAGAVDRVMEEMDRLLAEGPASVQRLFGELGRGQVLKATKTGLELSRALGDMTETIFKVGLLLDGLQRGMPLEDSVMRVVKYLFDYSDLTRFERFIRAFPVPFYTFMRKALPVMLETIYTRPGVYLALGYAHKAAADTLGLSPEELPDWARESLAVPVKIGNQYYLVNLGLPTDLLSQVGPYVFDGKTFRELVLASLHPVLRVPIELAANQQFFSGIPISRGEFDTTTAIGGVQLPEGLAYAASQLLPTPFVNLTPTLLGQTDTGLPVPFLGGGERPEPVEPEWLPPRPEPGLGRLLLRLGSLSGLAVPFSPERQAVISRMLYAQRLRDMIQHLQKDLGIRVPTVQELEQASDPLQTLLGRLRSVQSSAF